MTRSRLSTNRQPRRGFTLIELLVVISIIAVLASLIAPAVQSARRSARKLECLNNIRQVGVAMQSFASQFNGQLPTLTSNLTNDTQTGTIFGAGWPVALLPALDQTALLKNLRRDAVMVGTTASTPVVNTPFAFLPADLTWVPAFTCPDDTDSFRRPGGLSYVVNSGYIASTVWGLTETNGITGNFHQPLLIDWNGNGTYSLDGSTPIPTTASADTTDLAIESATGVIFRPSNFQPSLEAISVGDGQGTTLLLTENLNAGTWNSSQDVTTGYGVNELGFGINLPVGTGNKPTAALFVGTTGTFNASNALNATNSWLDTTVMPDAWVINRNLTAGAGTAPRPSSNHMGGVNAIMADGSGKFINEQIDKLTYSKLVTSNGVNFGETRLDSAAF